MYVYIYVCMYTYMYVYICSIYICTLCLLCVRVLNTKLSKYLWTLKANGTDYHLKWSVKSYASRYKCGTSRCDLCLTEKMIIALADPKVLLNKRTELMSKCCHRNKFIMSKVK